jgi:hypothetical protein
VICALRRHGEATERAGRDIVAATSWPIPTACDAAQQVGSSRQPLLTMYSPTKATTSCSGTPRTTNRSAQPATQATSNGKRSQVTAVTEAATAQAHRSIQTTTGTNTR